MKQKKIFKKQKLLLLNQKQIELVALIITIIVLLILASVSISLLFGENGIMSRATYGKIEHQKASDIEMLKIKEAEYGIEKQDQNVTIEEYINYIDEKGIIDKEEVDYEDTNTNKATGKRTWFVFYVPGLQKSFFMTAEPSMIGMPAAEVDSVLDVTVNIIPTGEIGWATTINPTDPASA